MSSFHAVPPRVARDRRDDRFQAGRWTPYARPAAGWVESVQDDTCTVNILNESITGVIYLDDKPSRGDIVEIETRGDLVVVLNWYEHPAPPAPEPVPNIFVSGYDTGPPHEPAWDAAVGPSVSDDSDDTFVHFNSSGGHDLVFLVGDPSRIPAGRVTAITIYLRARSFPIDARPIGLIPRVYTDYDTYGAHGYIEYYGPPPEYWEGMTIPSSTFTDMSVTLTEAMMPTAMGNEPSEWGASNLSDTWTTLEEFADRLRNHGVTMDIQFTNGYGQWDIAAANLLFEIEGGQ